MPKRVLPELDSDDEMLVSLKEQGLRDNVIAARFREEGRIAYEPKSISTRYGRIKRTQQQQETEALDEQETDWHVGDVSERALSNATPYLSRLMKIPG